MTDYTPILVESAIPDEMCQRLFELASTMTSIVEIGSFCGKSTHALLSGCKGKVWAVDHFKGSKDPGDTTHKRSGKEVFLRNCGEFPNLEMLEMESADAAKLFEPKSVDMVFIDAGHMFDEVTLDLQNWIPKARILVCGHDWCMNEVRKAIEGFGLKCEFVFNDLWEHWLTKQGDGDVAKQD